MTTASSSACVLKRLRLQAPTSSALVFSCKVAKHGDGDLSLLFSSPSMVMVICLCCLVLLSYLVMMLVSMNSVDSVFKRLRLQAPASTSNGLVKHGDKSQRAQPPWRGSHSIFQSQSLRERGLPPHFGPAVGLPGRLS